MVNSSILHSSYTFFRAWSKPAKYHLNLRNQITIILQIFFREIFDEIPWQNDIFGYIPYSQEFGFMSFNLILTAFIGLGGLKTIPHCFKLIKQEKTKRKIFYILTLIQILLQIIYPFIRAWIVILSLDNVSSMIKEIFIYIKRGKLDNP